MKIKLSIRLSVILSVIALALASDAIYFYISAERHRLDVAEIDVMFGNTRAGHLNSKDQILCPDKEAISLIDRAADLDAKFEVMKKFDQCVFSTEDSRYDVGSDGRQVYVTPHGGTIALWATKYR